MKIGIDISPLAIPYPNGTATYAKNLIVWLANIDKKNEYVLFSSKHVEIPKQKNISLVVLPSFPLFKRKLLLPIFVRKNRVDVFHFLNPFGSIFFGKEIIITTIQDTQKISKKLLNRSKSVICTTDTIKQELVKFGIKANVIPHGVDSQFKPSNSEGKIILCFADYSPRKNISRVLQAYRLLPKSIQNKHKLHIVLSPTASFLKENSDFILEKKVTDKKLLFLYQNAALLLYPSLYEGFGLPILEAMASGVPVITSNYGAMKEVSGGAAHLVDPLSLDDINNSMLHILTDTRYHKKLQQRGLVRAKQFSWIKTATETLKVYEEIYKTSSRSNRP